MSRTDAHRPYWVQATDPTEQRWYWHWEGSNYGWRKAPLYRTCGCKMFGCGTSHTDRIENRRNRHDARSSLREVLKGAEQEVVNHPFSYYR